MPPRRLKPGHEVIAEGTDPHSATRHHPRVRLRRAIQKRRAGFTWR
jgi:hypothetical protein